MRTTNSKRANERSLVLCSRGSIRSQRCGANGVQSCLRSRGARPTSARHTDHGVHGQGSLPQQPPALPAVTPERGGCATWIRRSPSWGLTIAVNSKRRPPRPAPPSFRLALASTAMRTQKGLLLTCDVGVKEYLVWLERSGAIASFILKEIDDHHLFVATRPHLFEELQEYLDAWHDANSFSATQNAAALAAASSRQSMSHLPPAAQRHARG